ncbi:hypothetical protein [Enterovibrio norvegicus]|uniref:hypothetical protein n=1 Tax=Enterovibrio norvegicus TaxID=188144 RepID=UPI0024B16FE1|nr:hypothetical protein [Enterovibrio norvegicus]
MPKFDNPVRGVLSCPVCSSKATAHQCGEGQLIATGEPPKNSRNVGLMYYRCPECGNSSISKKITEYIEANMSPPDSEPLPFETANNKVFEPSTVIEQVTEQTETLTEPQAVIETLPPTDLANTPSDKTPVKRWLLVGGAALFLLWMVTMLFPKRKPKTTEQNNQEESPNAVG